VGQSNAPKDSEEPGAQEAFPGLLRRDLDERCPSKGDTAKVCKYVVRYHHRHRQDEPYEALEDIVNHKVGLSDDQEESHMRPCKLGELELIMALLQRIYEEDEADDVEHKGDEAVVGGQRKQDTVDQQDVLEVIDDAFAVQKVHGGAEKVPVQRLGEAQATGPARHVRNGNDLLEGYDLDGGDYDDDVDVTGAEDPEEAQDHDEGPYGARNEVCLFLFVFGLLQRFWRLGLSAVVAVAGRSAYRAIYGAVGRRAARLAVLREALRQAAGSAIAGAPVLELDVFAWAGHAAVEPGRQRAGTTTTTMMVMRGRWMGKARYSEGCEEWQQRVY
jgi:hypothetical protein